MGEQRLEYKLAVGVDEERRAYMTLDLIFLTSLHHSGEIDTYWQRWDLEEYYNSIISSIVLNGNFTFVVPNTNYASEYFVRKSTSSEKIGKVKILAFRNNRQLESFKLSGVTILTPIIYHPGWMQIRASWEGASASD